MPALPPTPSPVLKVRLNWQRDGDALAQTIHYFEYTGDPASGSELVGVAEAVGSSAEVNFQALADTHTGVNSVTVTDLSVAEGNQGEDANPFVGTRTGGQLAPGTAAVVNHSIARTYRGGKPKTFLPLGTSTDLMTSGVWASAFTADVDTAWGAFTAGITGTAVGGLTVGNICNVSYFSGGSTVVISPTTGRARNVPKKRDVPKIDEFLAHVTATRVGSQRRRNRDA